MSRARHKGKSSGGAVYYAGGGSNVAKEAAEKKHGGAVKNMGKIGGMKAKKRLDKRARGGRVGSDRNPFSSAASPKPTSEPSAKA